VVQLSNFPKCLNTLHLYLSGQEPEGGHGKWIPAALNSRREGVGKGNRRCPFLRKVPPPSGSRPRASGGPERDGNGAETTQPAGQDDSLRMTFPRDLLKRPTPEEQVQVVPMSCPMRRR